jgi:hypothetical protein
MVVYLCVKLYLAEEVKSFGKVGEVLVQDGAGEVLVLADAVGVCQWEVWILIRAAHVVRLEAWIGTVG